MGELEKKIKLSEKIATRLLSEDGSEVEVEELLTMDSDPLVELANLVFHNGEIKAQDVRRKTESQYLEQVTDELIQRTNFSYHLFDQATPHSLTLLNCEMKNKAEKERDGRGAFMNTLLENLGLKQTTAAPTTATTTAHPLLRWIGGFAESHPAFAYPNPDLTSLLLLGNMDNINKLDLQQKVKWPEFSWETELKKPESRAFQRFAPDISRIGYTVEGRVYSIICPQMGAMLPSFGSVNVEVTVTGQRGWVNQPTQNLAADMTVVGKIWFTPSALNENKYVKWFWEKFLSATDLPFPSSKKNSIIVNTQSANVADQSFFFLSDGESTEFKIPEFAKHSEAWNVGNLRVKIGQIKKTSSASMDHFNQLVINAVNTYTGNMLLETNTLYWNVWFTDPQNVNRTEWRNHAEEWRDSIETDHMSPKNYPNYDQPKYFNGDLLHPLRFQSCSFDGTNHVGCEDLLTEEFGEMQSLVGTHFPDKLDEFNAL